MLRAPSCGQTRGRSALSFWLSSCKQRAHYLVVRLGHFLCILLVILLLTSAPKRSAEVQSLDSKPKKAARRPTEKTRVLGELGSGPS